MKNKIIIALISFTGFFGNTQEKLIKTLFENKQYDMIISTECKRFFYLNYRGHLGNWSGSILADLGCIKPLQTRYNGNKHH